MSALPITPRLWVGDFVKATHLVARTPADASRLLDESDIDVIVLVQSIDMAHATLLLRGVSEDEVQMLLTFACTGQIKET